MLSTGDKQRINSICHTLKLQTQIVILFHANSNLFDADFLKLLLNYFPKMLVSHLETKLVAPLSLPIYFSGRN